MDYIDYLEILIPSWSGTPYGLQRAELCEVWFLHAQHEIEQFSHQSPMGN